MRLQFKQQAFQADAARAVVDVFAGQPFYDPSFQREEGENTGEGLDPIVWGNQKIVSTLSDEVILEQLREVQKANQIQPSGKLEGHYNLTVEMETGVGKTYTYIKTMYELNRVYGWSKFIVVTPSVAVREGVYKTFQMTQEHFAEEYGRKIRFFLYDSSRLMEIDRFASDRSMHVMIINAQAFHAKSREARRIYVQMDAFGARRPIDLIARTNPIVIIDEPQSVEGRQTKENLKQFQPLMTLRYSATHRADSIYNMVYRLDAVDAYRRQLVKRIAVKGITENRSSAVDSYVYLEGIHLSRTAPMASLQFDCRTTSGIQRKTKRVGIGFDLYAASGELAEYKEGYVVKHIDGRDDSVEFFNGIRIYGGDVIGEVQVEGLRRIQIRETILSHIERERRLFYQGIKVLSLFFIDEVAHYREYDEMGQQRNGVYAEIFEEEYQDIIATMQERSGEEAYRHYLASIPVADTHAGYFSIDRKGRMVDQTTGDDRKNKLSNDHDAYELIMKNKELLLDQDPDRSPVRFIFSHSALREGWDNPNVFQICTLKQSGSNIRRRQEVGRGLRLCVNQEGERMDESVVGNEIHDINVLTVIASESYESFAKGLQTEISEALMDRRNMEGEYDSVVMLPENARGNQVELQVEQEKLDSKEFQALWSRVSPKSVYRVRFDTKELVEETAALLDSMLRVSDHYVKVESGQMRGIFCEEETDSGVALMKKSRVYYESKTRTAPEQGVKYDLLTRLVDETGLTRKAVVQIMTSMKQSVFEQFKVNPEEFIRQVSVLINRQKTVVMTRRISYMSLEGTFGTDIFTAPLIRGRLGQNVMQAGKHLYDYVQYDTEREKVFAEKLEVTEEVAVYAKLPDAFYISTPVGRYRPDWIIAFQEGTAAHTFFVVDTKVIADTGKQMIEQIKRQCAREHFKAVSNGEIVYDVVESFDEFMDRALSGVITE